MLIFWNTKHQRAEKSWDKLPANLYRNFVHQQQLFREKLGSSLAPFISGWQTRFRFALHFQESQKYKFICREWKAKPAKPLLFLLEKGDH